MLCWKVLGVNLDTLMSVESMKQNPVKTEVNQAEEEEEEETLLAISSITNSTRTGTKNMFFNHSQYFANPLPRQRCVLHIFNSASTFLLDLFHIL